MKSKHNKEESRRGFLKKATFTIGGIIGTVMAVPIIRYVLYPIGRKTVSAPDLPIDIIAESKLVIGANPIRLPIIASGVKDGWTTVNDVAIGSCWVRRDDTGKITAFSSVCPHLGCSVSFNKDSDDYQCPCHNSAFDKKGNKKAGGPAKRGLDPLEVFVVDGRVKIRYQRFRNDIKEREPV